MIRTLATCTVALALVAAGCGDDGDDDATAGDAAATAEGAAEDSTGTEAATETEETTGSGAATGYGTEAGGAAGAAGDDDALEVTSTELGDILVVGDRTVYIFDPDEQQGESTCVDLCEASWPPVRELVAGEGVDQSLLGTTTREDGSVQATYNDWPIYFFATDVAPGDVNGQAVGDVWWVLDASGEPLRDAG